MPRSNFGPEVKAGMQGNANSPARVGTPRPTPQPTDAQASREARDSSGNSGLPPPNRIPGPGRGGMPGMGPAMPGAPDAHHVAAAASIAHAILGNRGIR